MLQIYKNLRLWRAERRVVFGMDGIFLPARTKTRASGDRPEERYGYKNPRGIPGDDNLLLHASEALVGREAPFGEFFGLGEEFGGVLGE